LWLPQFHFAQEIEFFEIEVERVEQRCLLLFGHLESRIETLMEKIKLLYARGQHLTNVHAEELNSQVKKELS